MRKVDDDPFTMKSIALVSFLVAAAVVCCGEFKPEHFEDAMTLHLENGEFRASATSPRLERFFDDNIRKEAEKYVGCFQEPAKIEIINYTTTMKIQIHGYAGEVKDVQSKVETLGCYIASSFLYREKKNLALKTNHVAFINPLPENRYELCINIKTVPMR